MFISYEPKLPIDPYNDHFIYILTDTEFSCELEANYSMYKIIPDIYPMIREYQNRNLPVAENIFLFILFFNEKIYDYNDYIFDIKRDIHLRYLLSINGWQAINQKLDELIQKHYLLQ